MLFRVYRKAKRMTKRMVTPRTAETIVSVGVLFFGSRGKVLFETDEPASGERSAVPLGCVVSPALCGTVVGPSVKASPSLSCGAIVIVDVASTSVWLS